MTGAACDDSVILMMKVEVAMKVKVGVTGLCIDS